MGNLAHGLRLSSYLAFALPLWVENWERFRLLEQRRLEVSAVVQLTGALARSLDVQEVLQRVYTQAQTLFAAEGIRVETFGENQVNGRVSAVYGWGEEDWQSTLNRSDVVFTEINLWEPQAPRVITDVQQNPPLAVVLAPLGVRGVVSLPLVENGEISGVFFLLWRKPIEPWSSSHLRLAKALADEAMVALQRARLYEEEERRRRQLQALLEISALLSSTHDLERLIQTVLAQAVQLITPVDSGALLLYDEETDKLNVRAVYGVAATSLQGRKFSLQEGLFGRVFRTGKPQVTWEGKPLQVEVLPRTPAQPFPHHRLSPPEVLSDLLCVPLVAQEKPIGVVVLRATPGSAPFTQEDVSLLQAFANQAAVAIENARLYRAIHQLAITDPLTGLFNRRHFESRLGIELARADRAQQPVSLVLLDIDHFKPFNDRFGHLCGDRLLKRLAHFVQGAVRRIDVVARIGGEEFAIILPLTGKQGALIVADNLRRGVAALEFEGDGDQPVVHKTISLGVATYPDDAEAAEALLQRADEALYRAKREGRNRVCGAEEGQ
ncbi:MAG TPA: diguanylate cyclase [Armatimonadetes bacterium]|nr:diguanylate cyclase [Armatimonadota bacterium]